MDPLQTASAANVICYTFNTYDSVSFRGAHGPAEDLPSSFESVNCCAVSGFEAKVERCLNKASGWADYAAECASFAFSNSPLQIQFIT